MRYNNTEPPSDVEAQQFLVAALFAVVTFCAGVLFGAAVF